MQSSLTAGLNNYETGTHSSVPFVGEALGQASQVVGRFGADLKTALSNLGTISNPTDNQIKNALASLPALWDRNGNGAGADDVLVTRPGHLGSEGFAVQLRLTGAQQAVATTIDFNTGLPGLPFSISADGEIEVSVGFAYELAFNYNAISQLVALDSSTTLAGLTPPSPNHPVVDLLNPLAIFVSAGLSPDFNASATMGFVQGSATPLSGQTNALHLSALVNHLTGTPTIKLDGTADANLRLTSSFTGTGNDFPGIDTDFHLHWALSSNNPGASAPEIVFDNVHMNLGKFISNVVGPVFEAIQDATDPLGPVLEVLDYPLPGITDLSRLVGGGDISLLDIGGAVAPFTGFGPLYDLVHQVIDITNEIRDLDIGETVRMPLGGFDLDTYDLRGVAPAGSLNNLSLPNLTDLSLSAENLRALGQTFDQIVAGLDVDEDVKAMLGELTAGLNNGFDVSFPILDSPQDAVFGMLLGRDSDLFTLTAEADFEAEGSLATGLSVFGLGVTFEGEVSVDTRFKFAYDTFGLRTLMNNLANGETSHIASDILDGFYVGADSYFNIGGRISAGVGASIGFFSAKVGGFVSTDDNGNDPVSITITDPNSDGKLRFAEFESNPFNMSGRLSAALGVEVAVGFDPPVGPFIGWRDRFDVASVVIVDLDNPPEPGAPPIVLASQPDAAGTIQLYIGEQAHLRSGAGVGQANGDEQIIIRNVKTTGDSETIEIALRQEDGEGNEYWVRQEIAGVKWVYGEGDLGNLTIDVLEGVNVNVHFEGGEGTADLRYHGTGSAHLQAGEQAAYLSGGQGGNTLLGGPANDTIVLGPGSNLVGGGLGDNMIVLTAPYTQSGIVDGGSDPAAHNTAVVIAGDDRWRHLSLPSPEEVRAVPGSQNSIQLDFRPAGSETFSPSIFLNRFKTLSVSAQDRVTDVTIGDLASTGITEVFINIPSSDGGRDIDLATRASGGPTQIALDPFLHAYSDPLDPDEMVAKDELRLLNSTTGVTTYLFGTTIGDVTTVHHHGGSIQIGQLAEDLGTIFFDMAIRQSSAANAVTMTTPAVDPGNQISTYANGLGQFVVDAVNYPTLVFHGLAIVDSMVMNVAAPGTAGGINEMDIDASVLRGSLIVSALGDGTANNRVTLSHVGAQATVAIHGGNTATSLLLATGQLAAIQTDVTATNVQLSVDNSQALLGSLLTLTAATFGDWILPGSGQLRRLNFSGLRGPMEVHAGAGDRYQLDVTPAGVTSLTMHNASATLDPVYTANWAVPLALIGNFAFYAGQRLAPNGSVDRVKRLANVGVPVTLAFSGSGATEVVLDGDLDPAGAAYTLDGHDSLHVANHTVGLDVTITGFRSQDELTIYMPGASVAANLQRTSPGTIYFDATARLTGTNSTAPNDYTIDARYGETDLVPLGPHDSLLDMANDVYLLGSMSQDSLAVNIPTHVRITASKTNDFQLELGKPSGWAEVHSTVPNSLIAWKEGEQREPFFVFENVVGSEWDEYYAPENLRGTPPNPFALFPYGVDVAYVDAPLSVEYFSLVNNELTSTVYPGIGRYFLIDPDPVATDNIIQLDASHLRGSFELNVTGPDYTYVKDVVREAMSRAVSSYVSYNGLGYVWGAEIDLMRVAFGQSQITLSHVNPELQVEITSQNSSFAYPPNSLTAAPNSDSKVLKSAYPTTSLNVGAGLLANIQGDVAVQSVALSVDNTLGATANNLILTGTALTGWSTAAGTTQPTLTLASLENRPLELVGSPLDRFGVETTPATAGSTTIRNLATAAAPAEVYVMGKTANRPLDIVGNFNLFVGRRLSADGTATPTGEVAGVLGPLSPTNAPINYDYRGQGHGKLVYDAATYVAPEGDRGQMLITSQASDASKGRLLFDHQFNVVNYGSNTDIDFYGPTIAQQPSNPLYERTSLLVDHRLPGLVRYFAGPTVPNHRVRVMAAFAPVSIEGAGSKTRVDLDPSDFTAFTNVLVMTSPGDDLKDTILANVTVSNAQLTIRPDRAATPAPSQLKNVVIATSQLTGIAGAPIVYANLQDVVIGGGNLTPGLVVQMPRHGANLTVTGTPIGWTTAPHVIGLPLGEVDIVGTQGRLAMGSLEQNNYRFVTTTGQTIRFAAESVTIGEGTAQGIQGEVLLGHSSFYTTTAGTVVDNRNDPTGRNVSITNPAFSGFSLIEGLTPAPIRSREAVAGGLSLYGSANSNYAIAYAAQGTTLYAGLDSTVDLQATSGRLSEVNILGAATVRQLANSVNLFTSPPRIGPDPARPNDVTQLIDNFGQTGNGLLLDKDGDGSGRLSWGNPAMPYLLFDFDKTHLTLNAAANAGFSQVIRVADSGPSGTVVRPGYHNVEVWGTTGPVAIHQGTYFFGSNVTIGNAGNMQAIQGEVTVVADVPALPESQLQLNNSSDTSPRTVSISSPAVEHWTFTGMAPAPVHVIGDRVSNSLLGGAGNSTLVGPNLPNSWQINAASGGSLNDRFSFSGFPNLVGGSVQDDFYFVQGGLVGGNLNGGPGFDTLHYAPGLLDGSETIDLPGGVAPLVAGVVSNVEYVNVQVPLEIEPMADRTDSGGTLIGGVQVVALGGQGPITYGAVGLPAGLSIDPQTGLISGTLEYVAGSSPYDVTVSASDGVSDVSTGFQWFVLPPPPPSLEELNAGTPAGVPFLTGILDPAEYPYPSDVTAVTYDSLPGSPTTVYFRATGQLWQYDGGSLTLVPSVDPIYQQIQFPQRLMVFPGHGLLFTDSHGLWLADQEGARVILQQQLVPWPETAVESEGLLYFVADQYDSGAGHWRTRLWRASYENGVSDVQPLTGAELASLNARSLTAFASGVAFAATTAADPTTHVLYWLDGATNTPHPLATSQTPFSTFPPSAFSDLRVVEGTAGSQMLYFYQNTPTGPQLRVVNSTSLPSPVVTTLATFATDVVIGAAPYPIQPLNGVDGQLVFSTTTIIAGLGQTQFWASDGTPSGTTMVGQPFQSGTQWGSVFDQTAFQGSLYFVYQPPFGTITPTTVVAEIWKLDPTTQQLSLVDDFLGQDNYWWRPGGFLAGGDRLFFEAWDATAGDVRLWSLTEGAAPAPVPAHANNPYNEPYLDDAVFAGDALYFTARSDRILDPTGYGTYQLWVLGPAAVTPEPELPGDYNLDGKVDAADYVVWRNALGTSGLPAYASADGSGDGVVGPEDYTIWRANYGRQAQGGAALQTPASTDPVSAAESADKAFAQTSSGEDEVASTTADAPRERWSSDAPWFPMSLSQRGERDESSSILPLESASSSASVQASVWERGLLDWPMREYSVNQPRSDARRSDLSIAEHLEVRRVSLRGIDEVFAGLGRRDSSLRQMSVRP